MSAFTAENIISRLAIARSLTCSDLSDFSLEIIDSAGKQIRGGTLLGRQEVALPLLAMIIEFHGEAQTVESMRPLIRGHWERGLRLIESELTSDMDSLLMQYVEEAELSDDTTAGGVVSPSTVLKNAVVGQVVAKRVLASLLDSATSMSPPGLEKPLLLKGREGTGRSTLAKAIASAMQVPIVDLGTVLRDNCDFFRSVELGLAEQGYSLLRKGESDRLPPAVIIARVTDFDGPSIRALLEYHPAPNSTVGATGGGLILISTKSDKYGRFFEVPLDSFTRDEVAEIIRRELGSWPLEFRRYLALAGRLNPAKALDRAKEFFDSVRASRRPSEGLLIETMEREWKVDRLGLSEEDYEVLSQLEDGPDNSERQNHGSIAFLAAIGLVEDRQGTFRLSARGRDVIEAHSEAHVGD